jgi:SP family general alpha glucoside:H+ symporter-like MFS transporter
MGSFFAYPSFQKKYGKYINETDGYQLSSQWQTGLNDVNAVGNIVGALINGYFTPKMGHRKVMLINLVAMTAFIFIIFFAPNLPCLLIGEFLCGIPWGVFTTMGPAYAAEVMPLALRGHLTTYVNLCWAVSASRVDTGENRADIVFRLVNSYPQLFSKVLSTEQMNGMVLHN